MGFLLDNCHFDRLTSEIINQCQPYTCSKDSGIDSFFMWIMKTISRIIMKR